MSGINLTDTLYMLDSFITHWKPLFKAPQYHNNSIPSDFSINSIFESIPDPFQGHGLVWLRTYFRTRDTVHFRPIFHQVPTYGDTDFYILPNNTGFYQKMKQELVKDSSYIFSYRLKSGSELKTYWRYYDNFANLFGVLFTTQDISRPTQNKITYYKPELQDTILDTTYSWRLIQNEFIADSAYQFINFAQFMDIRKIKYKVNKPTLHYFGGDTSYTVTYPFLVDDVRLLPKWQYLKTFDEEVCENDSVELKVISGAGPYAWVEYNKKDLILSNQDKIKIKVADTNIKYQVMSPYDTSIIQIKVFKKRNASDTINYINCNNESLHISNKHINNWNDNRTDTNRVFNISGKFWYETIERCTTKRTHLNIEINRSTYDTVRATSCNQYFFQNQNINKTGMYTFVYKNKKGCDSFIILDYISQEVSAEVEVKDQLHFYAKKPNLKYQWYICKPYWRKIENASSQTFTTNTQSTFAVVVQDSSGQCRDTSICIDKHYLSISNPNNSSTFLVYPNPFMDKINIENTKSEKFSLTLNDLQGKTITKSQTMYSKFYTLELDKNLPKGIYFLEIQTEIETNFYKVLKLE
jgi:hypothetical protein